MTWPALLAWGFAWLVCLSIGPVVGMVWDQRDYPANWEAIQNLLLIATVLVTILWGFILGRLGRVNVLLGSILAGAAVLTILSEISLKLVYRGDPSGPLVGLAFSMVLLAILLGLGGVLGMALRQRHRGTTWSGRGEK